MPTWVRSEFGTELDPRTRSYSEDSGALPSERRFCRGLAIASGSIWRSEFRKAYWAPAPTQSCRGAASHLSDRSHFIHVLTVEDMEGIEGQIEFAAGIICRLISTKKGLRPTPRL